MTWMREHDTRAEAGTFKHSQGVGSRVADQLAFIGALPPTVARAADCRCPPPGTRDAQNHRPLPGEAKTDAKEPAVIKDAAALCRTPDDR